MSGKILPDGKKSIKPLIVKLAVVLVPSYTVAYLTEAMVYTVPMLAAASIIATNLYTSPNINRRIDDEGEEEGEGSTNSYPANNFMD